MSWVRPGSGSCFLPIPDPGVKKATDPGSGSATLQEWNGLPYRSVSPIHCDSIGLLFKSHIMSIPNGRILVMYSKLVDPTLVKDGTHRQPRGLIASLWYPLFPAVDFPELHEGELSTVPKPKSASVIQLRRTASREFYSPIHRRSS
jgi:hypothetical protein